MDAGTERGGIFGGIGGLSSIPLCEMLTAIDLCLVKMLKLHKRP